MAALHSSPELVGNPGRLKQIWTSYLALNFLQLERFQAKWLPVRVKKTRQTKRLEPGSDSIRTDKALDRRSGPLKWFGLDPI
jgi:hypothetical protein